MFIGFLNTEIIDEDLIAWGKLFQINGPARRMVEFLGLFLHGGLKSPWMSINLVAWFWTELTGLNILTTADESWAGWLKNVHSRLITNIET